MPGVSEGAGGARGQKAAAGKGIACMTAGAMLLTTNDAIVKHLTVGLAVGQIMCLRAVVLAAAMLAVMGCLGRLEALRMRDPVGQGLRALFMLGGSYFFIGGLAHLPLADNQALAFAGPLFTTLLAIPILGEQVGWRRWSALAIGFAGVLLMLRPSGEGFAWAALLPLGAAVAGALRDIWTRRLSASESSLGILFWTTIGVALGGFASLPWGWPAPEPQQLLLLLVCCALIGAAHFLQIEAFRYAEAAAVAPFRYCSLVWSVVLGLVFWGDIPSAAVLAGSALVIGSGLYLWRRERRLKA
jgi:drug/metabolite transporter (DMT)-like permease